ncbi:mitochondrial inner membrane protease subunit 2 isoform X3 [Myotis daubentonii]|uniref:mitochondrial inner membrane protease subunit 2 isoform X3 n=1 Tax=Myotis daubentonii TaxID=98922 RepID=UPI00287348E0|nr:mitochondrial inner membrane protease subunit 2 isoform X3 [Myotis daubentonii]
MAPAQGWARRYFKAFCKGFFVAVPVAVTFLDRVACVARVEGASMQPSLNPGGSQSSDVVLLNHWKVRNLEVQRGDIVSLVRSRFLRCQTHSSSTLPGGPRYGRDNAFVPQGDSKSFGASLLYSFHWFPLSA